MASRFVGCVGAVMLVLSLAGCARGDPSFMQGYPRMADFESSGKALLLVDAESDGYASSDIEVNLVFSTLDAQPPEGSTVAQDKFAASRLIPVMVEPGHYSFLKYSFYFGGSRDVQVDIGGWTGGQTPDVAGFTVRAGEVIYLGHLNFKYVRDRQRDTKTISVAVEDRTARVSGQMRNSLDKAFPGASGRLQTRLITVYREDVPVE